MSASEKGRSESSFFCREFFFPSRDFFVQSFTSESAFCFPSRALLPPPLLRELPFLFLSFESSPSSSSPSRAPLPPPPLPAPPLFRELLFLIFFEPERRRRGRPGNCPEFRTSLSLLMRFCASRTLADSCFEKFSAGEEG